MFKKLLIYPLFILAVLFSTLALQGANSASAISPDDQVIQTATAAIVDESHYYTSCQPLDLTMGSTQVPSYSTLATSSQYGNEFTNKNSWGVSVLEGGVPNSSQVLVWWSDDTNPEANFSGSGGTYQTLDVNTHGQNTYYIIIDQNSSCEPYIATSATNTTGVNTVARYIPGSDYTRNKILYMTNVTVNYPEDYEGVIPPEDASTNIKQDYTPKVGYTLFDDKRLQALSIDEENTCIPTSQSGCIEPMYNYELIYDNETIDQVSLKRWEIYKFQYLNETTGTYTLKVTYHHPGPPYAPFSDDVNLVPATFEINSIIGFQSGSNGGINTCETVENIQSCGQAPVADFSTCFTDTFPYIDLPQCSQNFTKLVQLLSFNTIKFGNQWELSDGCHTLGTLGDWLNLTNKTVCPQFPQEVRSIVTPFVTLALGLITVRFLGNKEGYM